jgi:hypothetical protein
MRRLPLVICALALAAACSEPPAKEMNRAQGAIEAAHAAGADQYASDALAAATTALQQSRDAVEQRDYRLALSRALEAGDRAREAAKQAADNKARARSDSEAAVNAATAALRQLDERLKETAALHVPSPAIARARGAAANAEGALQKARAELRAGNYMEAGAAIKGTEAAIVAEIRELDAAADARSPRGPKRKR